MQYYMYREQIIHPIIMCMSNYFMLQFLKRESTPKFLFIFNMGYLSCQHINRMINNFGGWEMEITTYTMILTAKMSSLGFIYRDGMLDDSKLSAD